MGDGRERSRDGGEFEGGEEEGDADGEEDEPEDETLPGRCCG